MEIIAHRGASEAAPENTVAAARLAWDERADALEVDVRLTRDGHLAVIHDERTARVAQRSLVVAQSSLAELQTLEVGSWKAAKYTGEKIPRLDEVLATVPEGKRVFVEIKSGTEAVPVLARCLQPTKNAAVHVVVISFDFATVAAAKKILPEHRAAWILDRPGAAPLRSLAEIILRCREAKLDAIDLSAAWPLDAAMVCAVHEAGLKLFVWTVDDLPTARDLAVAGVDGITTNRPGWLREALAR